MTLNIKKNEDLSKHTSWMIGGPAENFVEPQTIQELQEALEFVRKNNLSLTLLGGGTNVLISDDGIKGLVVGLRQLSGIEIVEDSEERFSFWALTGTTKSECLKHFLKKSLAPAYFLAGLPGQVGGGVVMNAGVSEDLYPREFKDIVTAIEVIRPDGKIKKIDALHLSWSYRHCDGWQPGIITRVLLSWENKPIPGLVERVKELNKLRLEKQPLEWPSCGSVFRNPLPLRAGQLIESVGLKGFSIGGAQISEKHGNFIINKGKATAQDVQALMKLCVDKVRAVCGVNLKSEVVFLE
jgi:UDP-N-acetylmuramate dehydrogenase